MCLAFRVITACVVACSVSACESVNNDDMWKYRVEEVDKTLAVVIENKKVIILFPGIYYRVGARTSGTFPVRGSAKGASVDNFDDRTKVVCAFSNGEVTFDVNGRQVRIVDEGKVLRIGKKDISLNGNNGMVFSVDKDCEGSRSENEDEVLESVFPGSRVKK